MEPRAVVRQSDKSVAYDKIDPKELPMTKLTQKSCFTGCKKGVYKGGAWADHSSTGVPSPDMVVNFWILAFLHTYHVLTLSRAIIELNQISVIIFNVRNYQQLIELSVLM